MINGTLGHANIKVQDAQSSGAIMFRSDSAKNRMRIGDEFVSLVDNPEAQFVTEKIQLLNKGHINKINSPIRIPLKFLLPHELRKRSQNIKYGRKPTNFYQHTITFTDASPFKKYKFLDDYSYSLLKVYKRYIKPLRHFSKVVTEIPETDFETLKNEKIFIDRTVFGRLINALPYPNRLQFMLFCIEKFNQADLRKIHFSRATPYLIKFVGGVVDMGKYLNTSIEILNQHQDLFGDSKEMAFQDEENRIISLNRSTKETKKNISDNIYLQSRLFSELFEMGNFDELFSIHESEKKQNENSEFEKIFSQRPWPVDLNTDKL